MHLLIHAGSELSAPWLAAQMRAGWSGPVSAQSWALALLAALQQVLLLRRAVSPLRLAHRLAIAPQ